MTSFPRPMLLSCIICGGASPPACIEKLNCDGVLSKAGTFGGVTIRSTSITCGIPPPSRARPDRSNSLGPASNRVSRSPSKERE